NTSFKFSGRKENKSSVSSGHKKSPTCVELF
ncbi:MAG: hypothetical protein ACI8X3_003548, partial [Saprospiraceae bacterium]